MWPDRRALDLLGIELPILQAPMAGSALSPMAVAVANAGGLGAIACALLGPEQIRAEVQSFRERSAAPLHLNFFCHAMPAVDRARADAWRTRLDGYFVELGIEPGASVAAAGRAAFDGAACALVEELRPEVVSFHFGLPEPALLARVKTAGAKVLSSATTVDEARWLAERGCDAVIAQGFEAGGHRGMFLGEDVATQVGTMALVPQVVDAVAVPVIAAGGIADARGVAAAFALGACAAQIGTAYLFCPEAKVAPPHRAALHAAKDDGTVLTNVFTGRPARGVVNRLVREVGPMSPLAPAFPLAGGAVAPLRARSESAGSGDFSPLWSGQAAPLAREMPAGDLTRRLASESLARLRALGGALRP